MIFNGKQKFVLILLPSREVIKWLLSESRKLSLTFHVMKDVW